MKFLVINKPYGNDHGLKGNSASMRQHSAKVHAALKGGDVQGAWCLQSGGHAYILNAADGADLAIKLRSNPLYEYSDTEVIPVTDAVDFLEGYASRTEAR